MNRRIVKELRGIFPAWSMAAVLAVTLSFCPWWTDTTRGEPLLGFLMATAPLFLAAALCLATSVVYCGEFHFRTFQLLMAQPISRARIWTEKLLVLSVTILPLIALYIALLWQSTERNTLEAWPYYHWLLKQQSTLWVLFVLTTMSSAGFWSLTAKSLIGAVTLNLAAQMLSVLVLNFGLKVFLAQTGGLGGTDLPEFVMGDPRTMVPVIAAACMYSGFFAWLGWRKFRRLELAEAMPADLPALVKARSDVGTEKSPSIRGEHRPSFAPMVQKELGLHRSTLLLGAVFSVVWLIAVVVYTAFGRPHEELKSFLAVLTAFYSPLIVILAGCISIGEENRIGNFEWQLTFPVTIQRLWMLKIAAGALLAAALGIALPITLALATLSEVRQGFQNSLSNVLNWWLLLPAQTLLFLMSFWAASLLRDVIRATLTTVIAIFAAICFASVAAWSASSWHTGFQAGWLVWLTVKLQIPMSRLVNALPFLCVAVWSVALSLVLLWQSMRAFKRNTFGVRPLLNNSTLLLIVVLFLAFWSSDLFRSGMSQPP